MSQALTTEAWVLPAVSSDVGGRSLRLEQIVLREPNNHEMLVEPLLGSWEGNMTHALHRTPLDVCRKRNEPFIVIGNAGIVRVLECGVNVRSFRPGDIALVLGYAQIDAKGFTNRVFGYDAPNSVGLLAKRTIMDEWQLIKVPAPSRHSLEQWAAFGVRYLTAWANWRVAEACWRSVSGSPESVRPNVCAWGGGVSFAELELARVFGSNTAMAASSESRLAMLAAAGITPIDRRPLKLAEQTTASREDADARIRHKRAQASFVEQVRDAFDGSYADIFVDNIGASAWSTTSRALGRPGVVTTCGWKAGGQMSVVRPMECFQWHIHVHTHFINQRDVSEAVAFAETRGWMPAIKSRVFGFDEIPALADLYECGQCDTYFPLFSVNSM